MGRSQWLPVEGAEAGRSDPASPGAPKPSKKSWYKRWWGIAIIVLGVLILIGLVAGGGAATSRPPLRATPAPAHRPPPRCLSRQCPRRAPSHLRRPSHRRRPNRPTRSGRLRRPQRHPPAQLPNRPRLPPASIPRCATAVRVHRHRCGTGRAAVGGEYGQKAQGTYVGDDEGHQHRRQTADLLRLQRRRLRFQGRELAPDSTAGIYANDQAQGFVNEINPGNSSTAVLVYDLPSGET